ncbi:hypothetical protein HAX54_012948, partial [Datura stramonium]|nr:hypothetical protein [Datura stramonium]
MDRQMSDIPSWRPSPKPRFPCPLFKVDKVDGSPSGNDAHHPDHNLGQNFRQLYLRPTVERTDRQASDGPSPIPSDAQRFRSFRFQDIYPGGSLSVAEIHGVFIKGFPLTLVP